jgi:hypothetical protein
MNPRANFVSCLAVSVCLLLAGSLANAQSAKVFFSTPTNLSHNPDSSALSYSSHMAIDSRGNINVIWVEFDCQQVFPFTCTWHLFFTRSSDGALSFSTPKDIANPNPGDALFGPQIAVDRAGNIDVVWQGDSVGADVFFSRSTDAGSTFSIPVDVSMENGLASDPEIAVDAHGNINVVWQTLNATDQSSSSFFSHSSDGVTFSTPMNLCGPGESCGFPEVALDKHGNINLVWASALCVNCTQDVMFSRSSNSGTTFGIPINLSNSPDPMMSAPELTMDPRGTVNVVWSKGNSGSAQVFFAHSSNGTTFSTPAVLSSGPGNSFFPELGLGPARDPNVLRREMNEQRIGVLRTPIACGFRSDCDPRRDAINAAWYNDAMGELFFSRSTNNGNSFSTPKAVTTPLGSAGTEPYMAVDPDGRINLVWQDGATSGVFFTRSNDGGAKFTSPVSVSTSPSFSNFPQILSDAVGNLSVTWFDETTPIEDVFFSRGTSLNMLHKEVSALPVRCFKPHGKRDAVLDRLERAKRALKHHDRALAVNALTDLVQHVNGCGTSPDSSDWIIDCDAQRKMRSSLNIVIAGLSH